MRFISSIHTICIFTVAVLIGTLAFAQTTQDERDPQELADQLLSAVSNNSPLEDLATDHLGILSRLSEASKKSSLEGVLSLLEAGADPNATNPDIFTPLQISVLGNLEVTRALLAFGADINARSYAYGLTPIQHAVLFADNENLEILRLLLRYGADPNPVPIDPVSHPGLCTWLCPCTCLCRCEIQ